MTIRHPEIIVPKRYPVLLPSYIVLFLMGPVRGGGDWQRYWIEAFLKHAEHWPETFKERILHLIRFAVPCRWGDDHPLARYFVKVFEEEESKTIIGTQTYWENYLIEAIMNGWVKGIVFAGLFPQDENDPRPADHGPYGRDTYGEVGRWATHAQITANNAFRINASEKFSGHDVILKNLMIHNSEHWVNKNFRSNLSVEASAKWIAEEVYKKI